jgi:ubiquinone/menaquinone biosynthesis C-methylase UbiE
MLDIGAREGYCCIGLACRCRVRHRRRIRIDYGIAEQLPGPDASADLIWCRDVLRDLAAFREFRRVLRPAPTRSSTR